MENQRRIALKVDCDTFEGTKEGLPNLLRLFERAGIRASFFFTLGPDRSGRAVRRIFTQKGFLKKMLKSNAVSMYGPKTMLYGTLLPAPLIGKKLKDEIHAVGDAGHDTGVHGWDHVRWHDRLDVMNETEIHHDYARAHQVFTDIFGREARSSAAPGWHATPTYLTIQDEFHLLYSSNTRLGPAHFPMVGDTKFQTLEIPTTLPTWDEALASPEMKDPAKLITFYRAAIAGTEVHTIHTEVEGTAHHALFARQIEAWKADGISFVALDDLAKEIIKNQKAVPSRRPTRIRLPHRGGFVSSSAAVRTVLAAV